MSSETSALLAPNYARDVSPGADARARHTGRVRGIVALALGLLFVVGVPTMIFVGEKTMRDGLPRNPAKAVDLILRGSPVIVSVRRIVLCIVSNAQIGRPYRYAFQYLQERSNTQGMK
jgi:hypothetical protein